MGSQSAAQAAPQFNESDEEEKLDDDATEGQSTAAETATAAAPSEAASETQSKVPNLEDEELPPIKMPILEKGYE